MDLRHPAGNVPRASAVRKHQVKGHKSGLFVKFEIKFFFFSFLLNQDLKNRRNPRLVPYALLDERTKKSNRDSLREAIRTMVGYGYDIDPPDQEGELVF